MYNRLAEACTICSVVTNLKILIPTLQKYDGYFDFIVVHFSSSIVT